MTVNGIGQIHSFTYEKPPITISVNSNPLETGQTINRYFRKGLPAPIQLDNSFLKSIRQLQKQFIAITSSAEFPSISSRLKLGQIFQQQCQHPLEPTIGISSMRVVLMLLGQFGDGKSSSVEHANQLRAPDSKALTDAFRDTNWENFPQLVENLFSDFTKTHLSLIARSVYAAYKDICQDPFQGSKFDEEGVLRDLFKDGPFISRMKMQKPIGLTGNELTQTHGNHPDYSLTTLTPNTDGLIFQFTDSNGELAPHKITNAEFLLFPGIWGQ